MKVKSPKEPIILTEKDCNWLENLLRKNEKRTRLTKAEKRLLDGAKTFDKEVKSLM